MSHPVPTVLRAARIAVLAMVLAASCAPVRAGTIPASPGAPSLAEQGRAPVESPRERRAHESPIADETTLILPLAEDAALGMLPIEENGPSAFDGWKQNLSQAAQGGQALWRFVDPFGSLAVASILFTGGPDEPSPPSDQRSGGEPGVVAEPPSLALLTGAIVLALVLRFRV